MVSSDSLHLANAHYATPVVQFVCDWSCYRMYTGFQCDAARLSQVRRPVSSMFDLTYPGLAS